MATHVSANVDDLYQVAEGKAELVDGRVVSLSPTGYLPNRAAGAIYVSLRQFERSIPNGHALTDNAGFTVDLPRRQSFSPDAAFYVGRAAGGRFLEGAPIFAVEVRGENDYGPQAEQAIAAKRADYFAAGTLVVWDVDVLRDEVMRVYRADARDTPITSGRGRIADAEPAVPGWRFAVDELWS